MSAGDGTYHERRANQHYGACPFCAADVATLPAHLPECEEVRE